MAVGAVAIPIAEVAVELMKFVPYVGPAIMLLESATGKTIGGLGVDMSDEERIVGAILGALPFAGRLLRAGAQRAAVIAQISRNTGVPPRQVFGHLRRVAAMEGESVALRDAAAALKAGRELTAREALAVQRLEQALGRPVRPPAPPGGPTPSTSKPSTGPASTESQAPAEVGDAAFKARMTREVETEMRKNMRNTIGSGGEAAAQASARTPSMDLNAIKTNFPQLDTVSRDTVASVKAFGVDTSLGKLAAKAEAGATLTNEEAKTLKSVVGRYDKELQNLRTRIEPGVPTKLGQAADLLATHREAIQAAGSWPKGLARNATPEQIAKFVNQQGVLAVPADHVALVRKAVAANARQNPAAYGLNPGPGLEKGIERLAARVQSLGLSSDELTTINKRIWGQAP
jgi:hypothetical protein